MSATRVAWPLVALTVALLVVMVALSAGHEEAGDTVIYSLIALAQAGVGALIVARHPGHRVGWLFLVMGLLTAMWETFEGWGHHGSEFGDWMIEWTWIVDFALVGLLLLWFPTGQLRSRRWRPATWTVLLGTLVMWPGQALNVDLEADFASRRNPYGVEGLPADALFAAGSALILAGLGAGVASLVVRFRHAGQVERQQIKWLALSAACLLVATAFAAPLYYETVVVRVAVALALLTVPVAAGIAILRYRLYDIDVVINRTVVYLTLTTILAGVYVGGVLLLQLVLSPSSDLAIAASTLAVAALFRPLRGRVQAVVDHRFFRRRYDAQATLQAFAARLRDQVSLDAVEAELRDVVAGTMQPTSVGLWLRGRV